MILSSAKVWRFSGLAALLFLSACASTAAPTGSRPAPASTDPPPPPQATATPSLLAEEAPPLRAESEFETDFSRHSVPYAEILSGGPPKDGIPAISSPDFVTVEEASEWLKDREPVVFVQAGDDSRAYPIQILMWHEIVNDTVGDVPLVVTFCPLCNTAIAFERTFDNRVLDFGTTGRLRYSNLIMYDRQTETWWQQATGEAIAGEWTGGRLEFYPASMISWQDFRSRFPGGKVLSRETGFLRSYGRNPYLGYDDIDNPPFLYRGPATPGQLPPVARVLTIDLNGEAVAYPYETLERTGAVNDTVGGEAVVVLWQAGTASPLDGSTTATGRDVGAAGAFSRTVDEQTLTFAAPDGIIKDEETGSTWNVLGVATGGQLEGTQLTPLVAINHFWFSWAAFKPETRIYQP